MNELVLLMQATNKLDEAVGILTFIYKDIKNDLVADNEELKMLRDEIAALRNELASKSLITKKKGV